MHVTSRAAAGSVRRWRVHPGVWIVMAALVVGVLVLAGGTPDSQRSEDSRAQSLGEQLKCLQCAGESVAASQAPLAQQFRDEIQRQLDQGATDDQIRAWFVDRYGEQVLLEPPSSGLSVLIWVLPALVVVAAVAGLWLAFGRWRSAGEAPPTSSEGPDDLPDGADDPPVRSSEEPAGVASPGPTRPRWRIPAVVVGVVVFAGLATWLVVWGSSDRGDGELTGGGAGEGSGIGACQALARSDPDAAIGCFDELLAQEPGDVDALTYRGWAHIRADDLEAGRADLERAVQLDPKAADPHVFLAVAAANEGDFAQAAEELEQFWSKGPSEVAISVVQSEGLEREVFFGLMSAPTRDCWQSAAAAGADGPIDQEFLDDLGACLDGVLAADPTDRDARLSRALAHVGPDSGDPAAARELIEGILAEDPDDADALALMVSLDLAAGDLDDAEADLERLERLPRGPGAFLIGDAATLRSVLEARRGATGDGG